MPEIARTHNTLSSRGLLECNEEVWRERGVVLERSQPEVQSESLSLCVVVEKCKNASLQPLHTASLHSLAASDSTTCLNLLRRSVPSLANSCKSPPINPCTQSAGTDSAHACTWPTQVCNCNQARSPVFTTERLSSKIWGSGEAAGNEAWSYLKGKHLTVYQLGSVTQWGPDGHLVWLVFSQQPPPLYPICLALFPGISAGLLYSALPLHELLVVLASPTPSTTST